MRLRFLFFPLFVMGTAVQAQQVKLWYNTPAVEWTQALPLGNGRLGAMVFGGVNDELIQLNDATLWSGGPVNNNVNPDAAQYLPLVRTALSRQEYHKADSLLHKMQGVYSQSFLPLGDIHIKQQLTGKAEQYYRDLDLTNATAITRFTSGGVVYTREMFISAPDQVIVIRLKASKKGQLNFVISESSQLKAHNMLSGKTELVMKGKAPSQVDPSYVNDNKEPVIYEEAGSCKGMRFELRMKAIAKDGHVQTDTAGIAVSNATEVTILLSAATSFNGFDRCPDSDGADETALATGFLKKAALHNFDDLKWRHIKDYQHFYNRVRFNLAGTDMSEVPTDERLRRYTAGAEDPSLESLYFQYGRYLLISCSRTKDAPANLQGLWNKELRAPWSSNYTININTQMNYWAAEEVNLMEMQEPLYQLIKEVSVTGKHTAANFYHARGWVAHHNTDIWALSNPVGDLGKGDPMWANWTMGGNWLCQFLWQHYQFTGDKRFLKDTAYPLMKQAADFCLDFLVKDSSGYLITSPSTSPENMFITASGKGEAVSVASTMDMSIIRDLFSNTMHASEVLDVDAAYRDTLQHAYDQLYPFKIGKKGNLQEWYQDFDEQDPEHRHISHLFALFPGNQISPLTTPELAAACKRTLALRGDGGTGWSKAWKINTWARLLDGNHAHKLLRELLTFTGKGSTDYHNGGGTYANLFCAHPPFQIDGNFGGTSGIAQMLLQSQTGTLQILPAIPDNWATGEVKGLLAEGGYTVDMKWSQGMLSSVTIHATKDGTCFLRVAQRVRGGADVKLGPVKPTIADDHFIYALQTKAGGVYTLDRVIR